MKGRAFVLADGVSTDDLAPGHCLKLPPEALAKHCLGTLRPDFSKDVRPGDFIIAGQNFGQGSSREQAVVSLKILGISAVICTSFARIFYRNAVNLGLPPITCDLTGKISDGDEIDLQPESGTLQNLTTAEQFAFRPFPDHLQTILAAGGMLPYLEARLGRQNTP